jgi:hypothetical protein
MAKSKFVHDLTVIRLLTLSDAAKAAALCVSAGIWFQCAPQECGNWELAVNVEDTQTAKNVLNRHSIVITGEKNRYFQTGGIVETTKGEPQDAETQRA